MIDRKAFFAAARARPFGGAMGAAQVRGVETILDLWERRGFADGPALAYVLATAFHETGRAMVPVEEVGRGRGKAYGAADPATGHAYYGRGLVQITWKRNYATLGARLGVDLVARPDLALDPAISADILVTGMVEGLFTGAKLADFLAAGRADWTGARRIVNGSDRAAVVAAHARDFQRALAAASSPSPAGSSGAVVIKEGVMKGYRTIAFNAVVALLGVAQSVDWISVVGSSGAGWAVAGVSAVNILLRAATTGPVGKPPAA